MLLSIALGTALLLPVSDPVPTLDVKPSCQAAAQMGDSLNARLPQCLESERTARDECVRAMLHDDLAA